MPPSPASTGVAITNPLVLYRSLLATRRIEADPAQHRLALHLQTLYERLKDYEPVVQYNHRLQQISRALAHSPGHTSPHSPQNGTPRAKRGVLSSLFDKPADRSDLSLTRVLTSHESAVGLDSPRGLMLHGEVGTGKSMLIDLFADCLPNRKKKRRHFSTFMLEIYAKLEQLRRSRQLVIPTSLGNEEEYSMLFLAREMISDGAVLFIDEFQLPDRAASKIMTNLMTCFFHLGGVLIATSNRMPEELSKAAGIEFAPPPPSRMEALGWFRGARGRVAGKSEAMYGGKSEFAMFLEVLRARCDVWEMESGKDYRRALSEEGSRNVSDAESFDGLHSMQSGNIGLGFEQSASTKESLSDETVSKKAPSQYFVLPSSPSDPEALQTFEQKIREIFPNTPLLSSSSQIPWKQTTMPVYGRHVTVPRHHDGTTRWTFAELCCTTLGPADYTTLASTFHTVILTDIPVLTLLQKNEARRLISLLDALYEARCRLLISAAAGPDELFFPETQRPAQSQQQADEFGDQEVVEQDATYAETLAEVYQDATSPFRPNIASYTSSSDSYTLAPDQLEDTPPNTPHTSQPLATQEHTSGIRGPDFSKGGIFTGEDEKFAFKRARSRMWEMCGARWWARQGGPEAWWRPLDASVRGWERPVAERARDASSAESPALVSEEASPASGSDKEEAVRGATSPFRVLHEPPPKFSWTHVWGTMKWGRKAGAWGQGVEGLEERQRARAEERAADGRAGVASAVDLQPTDEQKLQMKQREKQVRLGMMRDTQPKS